MKNNPYIASVVCAFLLLTSPITNAGEVIVNVVGAKTDEGMIGCALFKAADAKAFPMDGSSASQQWNPPENGSTTCKFTDLPAGDYAVSSSHDLNNNQETDTNFFGVPKEAWGVSKGIRPKLRAPRFDEARFALLEDQVLEITVEIRK